MELSRRHTCWLLSTCIALLPTRVHNTPLLMIREIRPPIGGPVSVIIVLKFALTLVVSMVRW